MAGELSFRLVNGHRVSDEAMKAGGVAVNGLGYRIVRASPTRGVEGSRGQWVGPTRKRDRLAEALPWPARRASRYEVYEPGGRLVASEPTMRWAMRQAVVHMMTGRCD